MTTMTHPPSTDQMMIGGIDTHRDSHTAALLTHDGRVLGVDQFPTTTAGYQQLLEWLTGHGPLDRVGIEGTGSYGAGLAQVLQAAGIVLVEVDRPNRANRRRVGKSDPTDAIEAARAVISGRATGTPKTRTGPVEALRYLHLTRRDAVATRARCQTQIRSTLVTAPDPIRQQLASLSPTALIRVCATLTTDHDDQVSAAVATRLRSLAREHQWLTTEITALDHQILPLVRQANPQLLATHGVGPTTASQLMITVGDNPDRINTEAAFAMLTGVAPLPASSGNTHRHRLNRGGDRQANHALWRIAMTRLATDPRTQTYRNTYRTQGHTNPETIRQLKRYIARELFPILTRTTG